MMILRIFRARARPGQAKSIERMQVEDGIPMVKGKPGLIAFYPAKPLDGKGDEFLFVTVWRDMASMKAWAGKDWGEAVLPPGEAALFSEHSVQHYEVNESSGPTVR